MSFYLGYFGWVIYIASCVLYNYIRIVKWKKKPVYLASNQWRIFFGLLFLILMSSGDGFNGIDFAYPRTMIRYIPNAIFMLSSFYLFFDAGLNWLRGLHWDYRGEDSGWMDSFKMAVYYAIKIVCAIAYVSSTIILWR